MKCILKRPIDGLDQLNKTKMRFILAFFFLTCLISCQVDSSSTNPPTDLATIPTIDLPEISYEDAGFNRDSIEDLLDQIQDTKHKDFRGLVVIKNNQLVLEAYYNTFWRKSILDIRSAGKSITTLLLGVAMKEGLIESLDQSLYSLFSKDKNPKINEEYKKIKLRDVLDMASGLDADSDNSGSPGQAGQWIGLDDWKEYVLNVPLVATPGERFVYADIHPLLIALAIEEASGMSLRDYAQEKLFTPLGIRQFYWFTNAANQTGAAGNLYLGAYDFAKLGMLVVNEGKWNDQQLIDPEYIDLIINSKKHSVSDWFPLADTYGMFWYKTTRTFGDKEFNYLFGSGLGGNHIVVFPEEEMVIAITSSAYRTGYQHGRSYAVMEKVLKALEYN